MNELFERHRDRLTPDEERRIWQAMTDARPKPSRPWLRALVPAAAAAGLAVLLFGSDLFHHRLLERPDVAERAIGNDAGPAPATLSDDSGAGMDREGLAESTEMKAEAPERADAKSAPAKVRGGAAEAKAETPVPEPSPAASLPAEAKDEAPSLAWDEITPAPPVRRDVAREKGAATVRGRVTDADGTPLALATIIDPSTGITTTADLDGTFTVPAGTDSVRVEYFGFAPKTVAVTAQDVAVVLEAEDVPLLAVNEADEGPTDTFAELLARRAEQEVLRNQATVPGRTESLDKQAVAPATLGQSAADARAVRAEAGGGASGEAAAKPGGARDGGSTFAPPPPSVPAEKKRADGSWPISVGGSAPVNGEAFDSMFFRNYGVNPFVDPRDDRFATFAVDVDNASYAMARSYLLDGNLPPAEAIRVEEFVNAFRHDYPAPVGELTADSRNIPSEHGTFAIYLDAAPSPFHAGTTLMRVGLKGREVDPRDRKPAVLTFVVDASGSMAREDRLELVKKGLRLLLDRMRPDDEVALVVYGTDARTILRHTSVEDRREIERAIDALQPEGATNAEAGLLEAYRLADRAYQRGCINRVILCSDGVANVGTTGADGILAEIRREAGRGIELTAVGFGMGNYNDVLMEQLADKGDGNYYYVDDLTEARRVFVENLTGMLQTIAREVKIQVEFDPDAVRSYRLIGYENRDVRDEDFRNDAVDAGEVGAGHEVTALFEVKLEGKRRGDLATVRIRYESPETGRVTEESRELRVQDVKSSWRDPDPSFRLDAAAAQFAEILRGSYWAKEDALAPVLSLARATAWEMHHREDVDELAGLIARAARLVPDARSADRPGEPREDDDRR